MFLLLQCGQTIPPFSYSEIVRIFENAFLQARQKKLYWGIAPSPSRTLIAEMLDARPAGVNQDLWFAKTLGDFEINDIAALLLLFRHQSRPSAYPALQYHKASDKLMDRAAVARSISIWIRSEVRHL